MNKYAALSLVSEAMLLGKRVVVITDHRPQVTRKALRILADVAETSSWPGTRVEQYNHGGRIVIGGGSILVAGAKSTFRGMTADVVFIDNTTIDIGEVSPMLASSGGDLVYS